MPAEVSVLLGVPYAKDLPGPFVASLVALYEGAQRAAPRLRVETLMVPSTAIHAARTQLVRQALARRVDYLVMVDSDQVFGPETVARLVRWGRHVVAPVIVARQGDPLPVAYAEDGPDLHGDVHYQPLADEVWAYLSQFKPARFKTTHVNLPAEPDHPPEMGDIPAEVAEGLRNPLLRCDAVGCGMVAFSRDILERVQPDAKGFFFDWEHGGEDLSFMRRVAAAGGQVYVDRGCLVGHLTYYSRGAIDLGGYLLGRQAPPPDAGPVARLADELAADGPRPTPGPWDEQELPRLPALVVAP